MRFPAYSAIQDELRNDKRLNFVCVCVCVCLLVRARVRVRVWQGASFGDLAERQTSSLTKAVIPLSQGCITSDI